MTAHSLEQIQGADQVVGVVLQGLGHALAHGLEAGEMDNCVNIGVFGKKCLHLVRIAHFQLDKGDRLTGDFLHPAQGFFTGIAEVIRNNDVIAGLDQLHTGVAADVARAAADQNRHRNPLLYF